VKLLAAIAGFASIIIILWDAFEAIILPRRIMRKFRLTRGFYLLTWTPWSALARRWRPGRRRESYLSFFGPLSLLVLLMVWAVGLIAGFALIHWALGHTLDGSGSNQFATDIYMSGTTFFTLGLGDVIPHGVMARALTVVEAGTGFGFLALVIGYLPVLYQSFSRREVNISLLDSRAGSPFSSGELLRRHAKGRVGEGCHIESLIELLKDWEHWSAELMESHLSYPVLSFFRSQHDNQSWVGALTTILDACAVVITGIEGVPPWQARLTFAMARHSVVDLSQVFRIVPEPPAINRLTHDEFSKMHELLTSAGLTLIDQDSTYERLRKVRSLYEPYVNGLAHFLLMPLPSWLPSEKAKDNWQKSAWERSSFAAALPGATREVAPGDGK
jgi:hypothetical protein